MSQTDLEEEEGPVGGLHRGAGKVTAAAAAAAITAVTARKRCTVAWGSSLVNPACPGTAAGHGLRTRCGPWLACRQQRWRVAENPASRRRAALLPPALFEWPEPAIWPSRVK